MVTQRRYWDIAWEIFPQSGAVQVLPHPRFNEPLDWSGLPREIDGHAIAPKVLELFAAPVRPLHRVQVHATLSTASEASTPAVRSASWSIS